jgi:hypothetical protein
MDSRGSLGFRPCDGCTRDNCAEVCPSYPATIADKLRGAANDLETEIEKARLRGHDEAALQRAEARVVDLRLAADDAADKPHIEQQWRLAGYDEEGYPQYIKRDFVVEEGK